MPQQSRRLQNLLELKMGRRKKKKRQASIHLCRPIITMRLVCLMRDREEQIKPKSVKTPAGDRENFRMNNPQDDARHKKKGCVCVPYAWRGDFFFVFDLVLHDPHLSSIHACHVIVDEDVIVSGPSSSWTIQFNIHATVQDCLFSLEALSRVFQRQRTGFVPTRPQKR